MQTPHRLIQAIFFRKQNLIIIVIYIIIVIIIMPSSFVHADRLKIWEITYNGDYRNGILEVCYHIWAYWIFRYDSYQ